MERKESSQAELNTPTQVYFWGNDKNGLLGPDKKPRFKYTKPQFFNFGVKIDSLACGDEHAAFISDGYLYTMGDNLNGRLGISKNVRATPSPCLVEALTRYYVIKVACGAKHSAALLDSGEVFTWGCGEKGQLGLGDTQNQIIPQHVKLEYSELKTSNESIEVVDVSCGASHTGLVTKNGIIFMFGSNEFGQLGNGTTEDENFPIRIVIPHQKAQKISCGRDYTLTLTAQGHIYAFGLNTSGQLGIGNKQDTYIPTKILIPEDIKISTISTGYHSAAISIGGDLYVWGDCALGNYIVPSRISLKNESEIVAVETGGNFTIALDRKGYIWGFGSNNVGELAQGNLEDFNSVVQIASLKPAKIKTFACGKDFAIALADYSNDFKDKKNLNEMKFNRESTKDGRDSKRSTSKYHEQINRPSNKSGYKGIPGEETPKESFKLAESDLDSISDKFIHLVAGTRNERELQDNEGRIYSLVGKMTPSREMKRNRAFPIKEAWQNSETNLDTDTDELREDSQTLSSRNQILDDNVNNRVNPSAQEKESKIRNILVDIKILRLQNSLLEQQLEERSHQIAYLRSKMKEVSIANKKSQEKEQKLRELTLIAEAQSLKFREENLKNSEELIKRGIEIEKLKRTIDEKNKQVDSLAQDNNIFKELVHYLLQLRGLNSNPISKDLEVQEVLETRIQNLLENLNFVAPKSNFVSSPSPNYEHNEIIQGVHQSRQLSLDQQFSLFSSSPNSLSAIRREQQKTTVSENKPTSRFDKKTVNSIDLPLQRPDHSKDKAHSSRIGSLQHEEATTVTEEPRFSTKVWQADVVITTNPNENMHNTINGLTGFTNVSANATPSTNTNTNSFKPKTTRPLKSHTKSQCSLNLNSLISPKSGGMISLEPYQKLATSVKNRGGSDGLISFHKKKFSEPALNLKSIGSALEEKAHKNMINNYFKTVDPMNPKENKISTSKDSKGSQSSYSNNLFTPAKETIKKVVSNPQISPLSGASNKDKAKPESSQLYRKLLGMLNFPVKNTSSNIKQGIKNNNFAGKYNTQK